MCAYAFAQYVNECVNTRLLESSADLTVGQTFKRKNMIPKFYFCFVCYINHFFVYMSMIAR